MAQHIGIEKLDENGNVLDSCNANFADIVNLWPDGNDIKKAFPLISYVDPYGDTYFNRLQVKDLVNELSKLMLEEQYKILEIKFNTIVKFINSVNVHQYIRFVGD